MITKLMHYISDTLGINIKSYQSIKGGNISNAYLIITLTDQLFLKINSGKDAFEMFLCEKNALEIIAKTNTILTPEVYHCEPFENGAFILMEYIECRNPTVIDFTKLGNEIANLHQTKINKYGLQDDNYIGSLHQSNNINLDWTDFYIQERIEPQLKLAVSSNLIQTKDLPKREKLYKLCQDCFVNVKPTLLHGDLWNGNFLISTEGIPYLIDPSVYYGDQDVDIAMTELFGGFGSSFYEAYRLRHPNKKYYDQKSELYQLYYLLVHLNLFGRSYYASVTKILNKYLLNC
ncbi:fructosamine kinase family protein [Aureispira]|nr:fructosamine kinase family protein [Aureispira sp.]